MSDAANVGVQDVESGAEAIFGLLSEDLDFKGDQQVNEGETEDSEADSEEDVEESAEVEDDEDLDDGSDDDDEADDEAEEEQKDSATPTYKVKVDGQELDVTLDEALAGYQRHQAFTKRTQALAEERRALQETAAEVAQKRQDYLDRLAVVESALQGQTPQEPNWDQLKQENPTKYAEMRIAFQERKEQMAALQAEQARVRSEAQAQFEAERDRILALEAERLDSAIPEWAVDPDTARAEKQKIADFALKTYGFSPKDLEQVTDHRVVLLLRDALRYNELQSKGKDARKVADKNRRKSTTLSPGTVVNKGKKSKGNPARARLAKSGSIDDARAVLFDMLE